MATVRINVNLSGLEALPARIEALKQAIIRWLQFGLSRFVLDRMKQAVPRRTGRLRNSLRFRKLRNGGRFYFDRRGFYWIFQDGLEEDLIRIFNESLKDLIPWAVGEARREVGI